MNIPNFGTSGNHRELDFIKLYPESIVHIFEDKLNTLEYCETDTTECIKKLMKLWQELDLLILKWT